MLDDGGDFLAERFIGVGDPGHSGGGVHWAVEGVARGIGEEDAGFFDDEHGGAVIGVAAEAFGLVLERIEHGAEVCDEAVVADEEFVELAAGADVLVVEDGGAGDVDFADEGEGDLFHEFGGEDFCAGKKLLTVAKPWLIVSGAGGAIFSGDFSPVWRLMRSP